MLRTTTTALVAAALAATGALSPAQAADQPPPPPVRADFGSISAPSTTFAKGCGTYVYDYAVTPPEGVWAIEVFITGPDGLATAAGAFLEGADPLVGQGTFKVCRKTVPPGTFSITAKVSADNRPTDPGPDGYVAGMLPTTTFTLTIPPRVKPTRPQPRSPWRQVPS